MCANAVSIKRTAVEGGYDPVGGFDGEDGPPGFEHVGVLSLLQGD